MDECDDCVSIPTALLFAMVKRAGGTVDITPAEMPSRTYTIWHKQNNDGSWHIIASEDGCVQ